jgi:NADPH:quinone reductase-like Zn-dependent oxidoreductase
VPSVHFYGDAPAPVAQPGRRLIRVAAISIEGGDLVKRCITMPVDQQVPLGYAAAGTVVALGDGVTGFAIGDRVTTADEESRKYPVQGLSITMRLSFERAPRSMLNAMA